MTIDPFNNARYRRLAAAVAEANSSGGRPESMRDALMDSGNVLGDTQSFPYQEGGSQVARLVAISLPHPIVMTIGLRADLAGHPRAEFIDPHVARATFTITTGSKGGLDTRRIVMESIGLMAGSLIVPETMREYLAVVGQNITVDCTVEFPIADGDPSLQIPPSRVIAYAAPGDSALASAPGGWGVDANIVASQAIAGAAINVFPVDPLRVNLSVYHQPGGAGQINVWLNQDDFAAGADPTVSVVPGALYETPPQIRPTRAIVIQGSGGGADGVATLISSRAGEIW